MSDVLADERRVFDARREDWMRRHPGEWVAIRGQEVVAFYPRSAAAWCAAIDNGWRPGTFLLKQVTPTDEPIVLPYVGLRE